MFEELVPKRNGGITGKKLMVMNTSDLERPLVENEEEALEKLS